MAIKVSKNVSIEQQKKVLVEEAWLKYYNQVLFEKGVRINVLNLGVIENTSTGRLIFTIFSAFADFERDLIVERTQEGKEIAKQRPGFKEGRPKKFSKQQLALAMQLLETHSYSEVEKMTGISKSTLIRAKKRMKIE